MSGLVFVGTEAAAEEWRNAEQRKYARRGAGCGNLYRPGIDAS